MTDHGAGGQKSDTPETLSAPAIIGLAIAFLVVLVMLVGREVDDNVTVAVATRDLMVGERIAKDMVDDVTKDRDAADGGVASNRLLDRLTKTPIQKDAIVTASAVGTGTDQPVKLKLDDHAIASEDFKAGDQVDLLFAPRNEDQQDEGPVLGPRRLDGIRIESASADAYLFLLDRDETETFLNYVARSNVIVVRSL